MDNNEVKKSGNELRRGKCWSYPECKSCTDVNDCIIEKRMNGGDENDNTGMV